MSDKMTQEELDKIIALHEQWLEDESTGERANFTDKDIHGLHFKDCHLSKAVFLKTNLKDCNFDNVDLSDCDFGRVTLFNVRTFNCNFNNSHFTYFNVYNSYITNSSFKFCKMQNVVMEVVLLCGDVFDCSSFTDSCLYYLQIDHCSFVNVYFVGAIFFHDKIEATDFKSLACFHQSYFIISSLYTVTFDYYRYTHNVFINCHMSDITITNKVLGASTIILPETGSFIGYKIALIDDEDDNKALLDGVNKVLVTLKITEDSKRSNTNGRKCRCSKAEVLSIVDEDGKSYYEAHSAYDDNFVYRVGEIAEVEDFDDDRWKECAAGIHFFLTKDEALAYGFN